MIDKEELRRLTQAATPGPWKVGQYLGSQRQFVIHMDVGDKGRGTDIAFTTASFGGSETIANARIIAAANPGVVLELLDEIERLRAVFEAARRVLKNPGCYQPMTMLHKAVQAALLADQGGE